MIELLNRYDIFFNFYAFGALLVTVFSGFLAVFTLSIKNKSRPTLDLGLMYFWSSLFFLGYFIASALYSPLAAYHRYMTLGFVYPIFIHFIQWVLRYPENSHPRLQRGFLIVMYLLAIGVISVFIWKTQSAAFKFHANAHYWDFDAEAISRYGAYLIMVYIFLGPIVGVWKFRIVKNKKDRYTIAGLITSLFIATALPGVLNTLSRDGVVDRSFYLNALVFLSIIGFFAMTILFLNTTTDRTTFMAKIVGICMVTFLLLLQGMAFVSMEDREKEYDQVRLQYLIRAVEGGTIEPELGYLYVYDIKKSKGEQKYTQDAYFNLPPEKRVDFAGAEIEYRNTALYEEIKKMDPSQAVDGLKKLLEETPPEFIGYRQSLEKFIESKEFQENPSTEAIFAKIDRLNRLTFVNKNRISYISDSNFRQDVTIRLEKDKNPDFAPFRDAMLAEIKARPELEGHALKLRLNDFMAPFKPQYSRHYRLSRDGFVHFIAYTVYNSQTQTIYEGAYFYRDYRAFIHRTAYKQVVILGAVLFVVLIIFPLFFRGSLVNPLTELLEGVKKVNRGNLDVSVPVYVQDEIGFLASSFNNMVASIREARDQLRDYANNLEEKVKERTAELNASLEEVRKLKIQQDGDYFLTSLLLKPLHFNANKSGRVRSDFIVIQKKQFEFRNKNADLGGDICITGNLRLGTRENYRRYIVAMNGDAMGKSMQGAGGALVMGVVMNSIMARSARHDRILDMTPEAWLTDVYEEINGVFKAFNGSMVISCVIDVIDEETGEMYYFNAEHPFQILYRNGRASFIEEDLQLRKLGLESEIPFEVKRFRLEPGDILIAGSDGRDDIDLTPGEPVRTINEDEFLILSHVEQAKADLEKIIEQIKSKGDITDDLSLLKIEFLPAGKTEDSIHDEEVVKPVVLIDDYDDLPATNSAEYNELLEEGRRLVRAGKSAEALAKLEKAYKMRQDDPALNKILAVLTFREKEYEKAVEILENYLKHDPNIEDFWLYLSIAHKRMGNLERSLEAAEKVFEINSQRVPNLLQLADLHLRMGHTGRAKIFLEQVFQIDPNNSQGKTLEEKIARMAADPGRKA